VGNTFIVKTNQWGKFSGQEHVPVVGTGKDVAILESCCIFMISVNFIKKKISKTTIIIDGPSSLFMRCELS
jgi:hypothetical protein